MHYRGGQEAGRAMNQQSVRTSFDFTSIEEHLKGVDVMDTLQNHKISRMRDPRRSLIAERSWGATSRTSRIKCACTKKDRYNPTWKNLTE